MSALTDPWLWVSALELLALVVLWAAAALVRPWGDR